jgi:hypothetical protein
MLFTLLVLDTTALFGEPALIESDTHTQVGAITFILMVKAISTSETLVSCYEAKQCITEDSHFQSVKARHYHRIWFGEVGQMSL